jgi:hypothetical protein
MSILGREYFLQPRLSNRRVDKKQKEDIDW